ncbi:peptidyl-prolyl cis-trans isomerase [Theileria orientalis strain Shintoku]|uniref:Peptidyl-prolyl cis-trans isomerase n=1 Tax=Theileria orientalis strain Shintoku TaxID=869250 RepID=J4C3Y7_THEOR|nr:peptidyl-prolyl cis-trans isomerase [Theileria orientalis strain Shintoku]PVC49714.1 peptidyl-prolyl cis-trans isomerase [Theileria orientalis]BAM41256.1 peptidyl-prolyl cis-trans isomerase [Theileria orientalis strain Shintoku]|eukprot:XP_009691557.1 peptidyl-prolyl cis-trans isomerase [Theileria orientalis strain Shintoku]
MEIAGDISPGEKEALTKEFRDLEEIRDREAKSRAVVLEILGDIPDADITPPKNVLFVCKLNPVTEEGDLKIIFSRFGNVKKCDIIKDYVTGDSLQYAFIEFETEASCNEAYFKMQNVLIDDRRIHVDFCQSVSGFWKRYHFKESFTRKRRERADYHRGDNNHRNAERDDTHSRKFSRRPDLEDKRSHHKHGGRHTTHGSREGRSGTRSPSESPGRRHRRIAGRSSPDARSERDRRSSSRDTFGRRKDQRSNYAMRSVSRGSNSRSEDSVRSTSISLDSRISYRSDHRTPGSSRHGSRPRRSRRSSSQGAEHRRRPRRFRRRDRSKDRSRDRFRRHRSRSRTPSRERLRRHRARASGR